MSTTEPLTIVQQLAKAYEAEDSQTAVVDVEKQSDGDGSDREDTLLEDTVVQNNDTYIDGIVSRRKPRYSESNTMTSNMMAISPNQFDHAATSPHSAYGTALAHDRSKSTQPPLSAQPSHDFLLIVENLQKELHQKDKALKIIAKQLKEKQTDFDDMLDKNDELNKQIKRMKQSNEAKKSEQDEAYETQQNELAEKTQKIAEQNEVIKELNAKLDAKETEMQQLNKEVEQYQNVAEWLQMQMTLETNATLVSDSNAVKPKLSVRALEEWRNSMVMASHQDYDDEKQQNVNEDNDGNQEEAENEETALLLNQDEESGKKGKGKKRTVKKRSSGINGEDELNSADLDGCCLPWFKR